MWPACTPAVSAGAPSAPSDLLPLHVVTLPYCHVAKVTWLPPADGDEASWARPPTTIVFIVACSKADKKCRRKRQHQEQHQEQQQEQQDNVQQDEEQLQQQQQLGHEEKQQHFSLLVLHNAPALGCALINGGQGAKLIELDLHGQPPWNACMHGSRGHLRCTADIIGEPATPTTPRSCYQAQLPITWQGVACMLSATLSWAPWQLAGVEAAPPMGCCSKAAVPFTWRPDSMLLAGQGQQGSHVQRCDEPRGS